MISDELNKEIVRSLEKANSLEPGTKEYSELIDTVSELDRMKLAEEKSELEAGLEDIKLSMAEKKAEEESKKNFFQKVDPNTWVSAGVSLFSVLSILNFERIGIVTSKALSFIHKPRLK